MTQDREKLRTALVGGSAVFGILAALTSFAFLLIACLTLSLSLGLAGLLFAIVAAALFRFAWMLS